MSRLIKFLMLVTPRDKKRDARIPIATSTFLRIGEVRFIAGGKGAESSPFSRTSENVGIVTAVNI